MTVSKRPTSNILIATKGHPFDKAAFFAMFDAMRGLNWTHVEQPAAAQLMAPGRTGDYAALLFYDVPGIRFRTPEPPVLSEPDDDTKSGFEALLSAGKPLVFLHHAMAGWPTWDRYAETIGARFFYQTGQYKGRSFADSGYMFPVTYHAEPLATHPILAGLEQGFKITDELYLFEMLDDQSTPLLRARFDFTQDNFYSAAEALRGRMWSRAGWQHPPGSHPHAWGAAPRFPAAGPAATATGFRCASGHGQGSGA